MHFDFALFGFMGTFEILTTCIKQERGSKFPGQRTVLSKVILYKKLELIHFCLKIVPE